MNQIVLKSGHVKPVWAGHPWIFPQGMNKPSKPLAQGSEVQVLDAEGHVMGRGLYSEKSAIAVRLFTTEAEETFGTELVQKRLRAAAARRALFGLPREGALETDSFRLFHGEGDGLPGLVVDKYGDVLVVQFGTVGMAERRELILDCLEQVFAPRAVIDRTTEKAARNEGFLHQSGLARGQEVSRLTVRERGFIYELPQALDQKTGYYFDQRPLRARVEELSSGRRVLDTYCYVGSIGQAARRGGAIEVVCVDSSAPALEVAEASAAKNAQLIKCVKANSIAYLQEQQAVWDLVVADPPKFAQSRAGREKALKGFRKVAAAAVSATTPGGLVVLSSCSAALGAEAVERSLALGAGDQGRRATVVERLYQGPDHPYPAAFSEGLYLSTVIALVD